MIVTNNVKWIAGGSLLLSIFLCGLYIGNKWGVGHTQEEINNHEVIAQDQHVQALNHIEEVKKYEAVITQQKRDIISKAKNLADAKLIMLEKDREFKSLLASNSSTEDKLSGALTVIEDKDSYISKQQDLLVDKDSIIDSLDKKSNELELAYANETKRADELVKALKIAKTIRQYKWTVGGSYDPINKDWGLEGYRNLKVARIGLSVNQVTMTQDKKEYRARLHLGINF